MDEQFPEVGNQHTDQYDGKWRSISAAEGDRQCNPCGHDGLIRGRVQLGPPYLAAIHLSPIKMRKGADFGCSKTSVRVACVSVHGLSLSQLSKCGSNSVVVGPARKRSSVLESESKTVT
jgi:hypothetical protein